MTGKPDGAVDLVIQPRTRDIGDFAVRRVLPYAKRRMVGPFVFLDEFGPVDMAAGHGIDVRPHPHIGLSTLTYLFKGEILHRDSLGSLQAIRPGAANWMTAGRGIVHSERSGEVERARDKRLHGMQSWVALPLDEEERTPSFTHHGEDTLPVIERDGAWLRLVAGRAYGESAPVEVFSDLFYIHAELPAGAALALPEEHPERAVYIVEGGLSIGGETYGPATMVVLRPGPAVLAATAASRLMLLGGAPLEGSRHIWWNFVSSSPERIAQAKADWKDGRFPAVPGDSDFIPLPEE
ncbi:pirin family protein [Pelagibius sp. 7325]|uniref:pirin family protein n=1 Tax=Pelagibius sp. 7325 TaxID=3131994 RepID=UPI0030ED0621